MHRSHPTLMPAARRWRWLALGLLTAGSLAGADGAAPATRTEYRVGPTRTYHTLPALDAAVTLAPGDLVLVDGDSTYAGGITFRHAGAAGAPIVIRGERVNGNRPVISGGTNGVEFNQSHYVFEGFEVSGATFRGLYHHADDTTIRDCVIHGCANGLMGADQGSGKLTVEYCEFYNCGNGTTQHQLYIATNEVDYPGSVFRLQFCYIHDGTGGNNVKSRAERNEIYYNWLDNPYYHNLELIGPDPAGGVPEAQAREDSDVVGNVLIARRYGRNVRVGGDGTGQSLGRYRFLNNTFIQRYSNARSHLYAHFGVESVEMHNNIFYRETWNSLWLVFNDADATWVGGSRQVSGASNWVHTGDGGVPAEWTGTLAGTDPGLSDIANNQLRPVAGAPGLDAGVTTTASPSGAPFPNPLALAGYHPPEAVLPAVDSAAVRQNHGLPDLGAFEKASAVDPRADVNADGVVNALDLQIVIASFGRTVGSPGCDPRADANADSVVNALDLQLVIASFGQTVP